MNEKDREEMEIMFITLDRKLNQLIQRVIELENQIKQTRNMRCIKNGRRIWKINKLCGKSQ